jgi:hypothetical protein
MFGENLKTRPDIMEAKELPMLNRVFKLEGRFDNASSCTVRMIERPGDWSVEIRPKCSRRVYVVPLSSLIRYGILQAAKVGAMATPDPYRRSLDRMLARVIGQPPVRTEP